jgi:hypothetical protein
VLLRAVGSPAFLGRRPPKESHKLLFGTEGDKFDERSMDGTLLRVVGRSRGRAITGVVSRTEISSRTKMAKGDSGLEEGTSSS